MNIEQKRQGAVTVLKPRGPICQSDADQVREAAAQALEESLGRFVLDATEIPFVDSNGLEALVEISEELASSGQVLKLCGAGETLREVLLLTELTDVFEHFEDVGMGVRSFL